MNDMERVELVEPLRKNGSLDKALCDFTRFGSIHEMQLLIDAGANPKYDDSVCVKYAVARQDVDKLNLLIKAGAEVTRNGNECMILAAEDGNLDIVKALIDEGANPKEDDCAYYVAKECGHMEVAELLKPDD